MQTVAQVKDEIYDRILIIAEPRAKYIPGTNKKVDVLMAELRQIAGKRHAGKPVAEEDRSRLSEIVTELNHVYKISTSQLSEITDMARSAITGYIKPMEKEIDERLLKRRESEESLRKEMREIAGQKDSVGRIPERLRPRISEVIARLHEVYGVTFTEMEEITGMGRDYMSGYMRGYFESPEKTKPKPFYIGNDPKKKTWWKKSGKSYKELWEFAQDISGISPVTTKVDLRKIAVEAVNYVNADDDVKQYLLKYIKIHAFETMQSTSGYSQMVRFALFFVQWLSERRGYEITRKDLNPYDVTQNPKGITFTWGKEFVADYVPEKSGVQSKTSMAAIRNTLIKLFKYLEMERFTIGYSMLGLITDMPRGSWVVAYNIPELDEMFNKIIMGKPVYYSLFMRLLLQVGSRPGHAFPIKCKHMEEFKTPVKDALGRNFYYINTQRILQDEKTGRGEEITKKFPAGGTAVRGAGTALISERLRNDLIAWCKSRNNQPSDYIFQKFISLEGIQGGIADRVHILSGYKIVNDRWVKDPARQKILSHDIDFYSLYGLRHTWTSVLYFIPSTEQDALDYLRPAGGWAPDSTVAVSSYKQYMNREDALAIAQKYEIYIPPRWEKDIETIRKGEEKKEIPGVVIGAEGLKKLEETQKLLIDQLNTMAKKIEELEGKKK